MSDPSLVFTSIRSETILIYLKAYIEFVLSDGQSAHNIRDWDFSAVEVTSSAVMVYGTRYFT